MKLDDDIKAFDKALADLKKLYDAKDLERDQAATAEAGMRLAHVIETIAQNRHVPHDVMCLIFMMAASYMAMSASPKVRAAMADYATLINNVGNA